MRAITFAGFLFAVSALLGQDAKIIIVERHDTTSLKSAYADYKAAQSKWERVKNEVAKKYTVENGKTLDGWDKVEFSVDFRALVPQRTFTSGFGYVVPTTGIWPNTYTVLSNGSTTTSASTSSDSPDSIRPDLMVHEPISQTTYGDQSPVISGNSETITIDTGKAK